MSDTNTLTLDEELEAVKQAAFALDKGERIEPEPEPEPEQEVAEQTEAPDGDTEPQEETVSEETGSTEEVSTGTDSEEEAGDDAETSEEPEAGEETKLSRQAKKDAARERSWQKLEQRNRETDERQAALDAREARVLQLEAQLVEREKPAPNDPLPQHSANDVSQVIADAIDEGDMDTAKMLAKQLASKAEANKVSVDVGPNSESFQKARAHVVQQLVASNPDLGKADTPLCKAANALLSGQWSQVLNSHPMGPAAAAEVAKLQLAAESVPGLNEQIEQLTTELNQLKRSTSLGKSAATPNAATPQPKKQLTLDQELELLRKQAVALDGNK